MCIHYIFLCYETISVKKEANGASILFVSAHGLREISVHHGGEGTAVGITCGSGGGRSTMDTNQEAERAI